MPWCCQHICLSTPPPRDVQLQKMPYPSPLRMHSLPLKLLVFNAILKKKRKTWWKGRRRLKTAFSSRDRNRIWKKKKAKLGNRKWITRFIPYDRVSIPHRDKLCQYLVISNLKVAKILEKYTAEQHATSQRCSPPFCVSTSCMGNYYVPNIYYIIYIHIMSYIKISTGIQGYTQLYTAIHSYTKPYKAILG